MSSQVWILDKRVFCSRITSQILKSIRRYLFIWNLNVRRPRAFYLATSLETRLPGGSVAKNHLPVQEMRVRTLGEEDLLEEELATHSSILAHTHTTHVCLIILGNKFLLSWFVSVCGHLTTKATNMISNVRSKTTLQKIWNEIYLEVYQESLAITPIFSIAILNSVSDRQNNIFSLA